MSNLLSFITAVAAWLQIVASPLAAGLLIGFIVYKVMNNTIGLIIGIVLAAAGLVAGILYANKIWKQQGTVEFIARSSASPELDKSPETTSGE